MSTPDARQRRIHRAQSARYLATLNSSCSVDELLTLDWVALETLPHWCFLPEKQQRELVLLCGSLFLAPMIQRWIDGRQIQSVRQLIGDELYQALMRYRPEVHNDTIDLVTTVANQPNAPEPGEMIYASGIAVLLGAIQHPVIARLLQDSYSEALSHPPLPATIAQALYSDALAWFDQLYPPGTIAAEAAANGVQADGQAQQADDADQAAGGQPA